MNTNKNLFLGIAGALALLLSVFPGSAAFARDTEDNNISVGTDIQAQIGGDDSEGARLDATASADIRESDGQGSDNAGSNREDSNKRSSTSTMQREDSRNQGKQENNQGDNQNNDEGDMLEISHDAALQATTTIETSNEVHNKGQLRSFLNHLVKQDDRVASVQVSSTTVETKYALPARLLGAIPMNLSADVTVGSDGTVTVTYPWYAFLFGGRDQNLEEQLAQAASSTAGVSASTTLSANTQAHLLNLLLSVLRGN